MSDLARGKELLHKHKEGGFWSRRGVRVGWDEEASTS